MKTSYIIPALFGALLLGSCAEDYKCDLKVDKPESVVQAEELASLDVLNSYVDKSQNPNFILGVAVNSADYVDQGLTYSIAKTNFDAVVDAAALSYGATVDDAGSTSLTSFVDMLLNDAPNVLGGPMIAYNALNKAQLTSVIADNFIKGDLQNGKMTLVDFESDALGTQYEMSNGSESVVVEDPEDPTGHVLSVGTADNKAKNSYPVINISLPNGLKLGNLHTIYFDIYCVDDNSLKKNLVMILNGARKNFTGDTPEKRGCPKGKWGRKIIELNVSDVDKLTDADKELSEFTLSLGPNVLNTYYYIDNICATWETGVPDKYIEKTPEEKAQALTENFAQWANSVMEASAEKVSDYVVIANPMSDDDAYMQRTAESETELGNETEEAFFLNDYMGDNYVTSITKSLTSAYSANGGTSPLKLYVSESGLLGNPGKTARLIAQVKEWIAAGAKIDGIAVNLPLAYSSDAAQQAANEAAVAELFKALAASQCIIRLDNVAMTNNNADYYAYVINQYFSLIPANQRGGIIFGSVNELWNTGTRTSTYGAVVKALK